MTETVVATARTIATMGTVFGAKAPRLAPLP
jgi:hypothetical protein